MSIDHGKLLALCAKARELQAAHYGDACGLHLDMIDWAKEYDSALAQPAEAVGGDATGNDLVSIGGRMANLCWNVASAYKPGVGEFTFPEDYRKSADQLRIEWDQARKKQPPTDAALEAVAWYVFADTEKWVTLDRSEADDQRAEGCQVRPLIFGDTHQQAAPAQGDGFYIASFKGERPGHPVMWWAPDNRGYTTDLEQAGVYAHPAPGYHDDEYNVPVPAVFVQGRRIRREIDPGDSENTMFWSAETLRAALAAAPSQEGES